MLFLKLPKSTTVTNFLLLDVCLQSPISDIAAMSESNKSV